MHQQGDIIKSKAECNTFLPSWSFLPNCHRRLGNVDLERWRLDDIALFGAKGNLWSSEGGAFLEGLTGVHGEGGKDDSMGDAALNHEAALAPEGAKGDRSPSEVGA